MQRIDNLVAEHDPTKVLPRRLVHPEYTNPQFKRELGMRTIYLAEGFELNAEGRVEAAKYHDSDLLAVFTSYDEAEVKANRLHVPIGSAAFYELLLSTKLEEIGNESPHIRLLHIMSGINWFNLYSRNSFGYVPKLSEDE